GPLQTLRERFPRGGAVVGMNQLEGAAPGALLERVPEEPRRRFAREAYGAVAIEHDDRVGAVLDEDLEQRIHSGALRGAASGGREVPVVPRDDAIEAIEEMLFLAQPVRLARIQHEIGLDAVPLQAAIKLLALSDRIGRVVLALQEQRRRPDVLHPRHRRALDEA